MTELYTYTPSTFPVAAMSHLVAMPAEAVAAGDLLLACIAHAPTGNLTPATGWSNLASTAVTGTTGLRAALHGKIAVGNEQGTTADWVTDNNREMAVMVLRFPRGVWYGGSLNGAVKTVAGVTGDPGTNGNPPSNDPGWGAGVRQVTISRISIRNDTGSALVTGRPSGFGDPRSLKSAFTGANRSVEIELDALYNSAGAVDPGAYTHASARYVASTFIVRLQAPRRGSRPLAGVGL